MSSICDIEDVDRPVMGHRYVVPCVLRTGVWFPVIGPAHEDGEYIGFKQLHWHYDFRFVARLDWEAWTEGVHDQVNVLSRVLVVRDGEEARVVRRVKRCLREMPLFCTQYVRTCGTVSNVHWMENLETAFADSKLKLDCMTCPHRGLPLKGLPVSPRGTVVCPGHGLAWNVNTGAMVKRATAAEERTPEPISNTARLT